MQKSRLEKGVWLRKLATDPTFAIEDGNVLEQELAIHAERVFED